MKINRVIPIFIKSDYSNDRILYKFKLFNEIFRILRNIIKKIIIKNIEISVKLIKN